MLYFFGKTMDNVRKRMDVTLVTTWKGQFGAKSYISMENFQNCTILDADILIIEMKKKNDSF